MPPGGCVANGGTCDVSGAGCPATWTTAALSCSGSERCCLPPSVSGAGESDAGDAGVAADAAADVENGADTGAGDGSDDSSDEGPIDASDAGAVDASDAGTVDAHEAGVTGAGSEAEASG
jgi:hypothetical protein